MKSDFKLALGILLLLTLLTVALYLFFAKSRKGVLRVVGITLLSDGLFLIVLNFVAGAIIKHQASTATESLVREAIPIAAHPLTAPIFSIGAVEFLVGILMIAITFLKRVNVNSQS